VSEVNKILNTSAMMQKLFTKQQKENQLIWLCREKLLTEGTS